MSKDKDADAPPSPTWSSKNPIDWISLLDAAGKKDHIPEWPFISNEIPKLKCEVCSKEFVSIINYRRHRHAHDIDFLLTEDETEAGKKSLMEFLNSLSRNALKTAVSLQDVKLDKEVSGHSIVLLLKSFITKPKVILPVPYTNAGVKLLDVVQSYQKKDGSFPVTVEELFEIFNDASEGTFFCSVIDDSVQTFVFKDVDTRDNIIACASFFLERKLVTEQIAESLIKEEENQKESQAKPMGNKKKKNLKTKKGKTQKPNVDPKSTEADEQIMRADVSTKCDQKDAELGQKEQDVEKPTSQSKAKTRNMKKAERKARKKSEKMQMSLGNKSDTLTVAGSSRSDASPAIDKSQNEAEQLDYFSDAMWIFDDEEDGKFIRKDKTSEEQKSKHRTDVSDSFQSGDTGCGAAAYKSPTEAKVTQRDNLAGDLQVHDADTVDGGIKLKPDLGKVLTSETTNEGKSEDKKLKDVTNASDILHSSDTSISSAPSKNPIESPIRQPDQSVSLLNPVVLSDAEKSADATKESNKDKFPVAPLADDPDNIKRVKEDIEQDDAIKAEGPPYQKPTKVKNDSSSAGHNMLTLRGKIKFGDKNLGENSDSRPLGLEHIGIQGTKQNIRRNIDGIHT